MATHIAEKKLLLGLVGVERSGKDTIADHLVQYHGFKKYSLASPIRNIGKLMFGWTDEQIAGSKKDMVDPKTNIKPRDFLTWFGTEICQFAIYNKFPQLSDSIPPRTIWANMMRNYIDTNITTTPIVVTDIRFKHEADIFEGMGGILIHVSRKEKETDEQLGKYDLTDLIKLRINYVFDNNNSIDKCKQMTNDLITALSTKNNNPKHNTLNINVPLIRNSHSPEVGLEFSVTPVALHWACNPVQTVYYDTSNYSLFI